MDRYLMMGLATVFALLLFFGFSSESSADNEFSGIVHDVNGSDSGFVFVMDTSDGRVLKCFSDIFPTDMGYYSVSGSFSKDGSIYFVKSIRELDKV